MDQHGKIPGGFAGAICLECGRRYSHQKRIGRKGRRGYARPAGSHLRSLLTLLKENEAVEFFFSGGGSHPRRWELRGAAHGATEAEAGERAIRLVDERATYSLLTSRGRR